MLEFQPLQLDQREEYFEILAQSSPRGCEYNFSNLFCWGRQKMALHQGNLAFFSQFNRKSVYPFPLGKDLKPTLDAIIHDAKMRGIPCRLTGMNSDDRALLEDLYPGRFRIHSDRSGFDYVYAIEDLAELKGRKYQKKRNHLNRFLQNHPHYSVQPISDGNLPQVEAMLEQWYADKQKADPLQDLHMERCAIRKALQNWKALGMEGILLLSEGRVLAMTLGSPLPYHTFDVQYEKALVDADGAYPAINWCFARYLREKYPHLRWLDREEDMGLEGLRKAKLSYCPDHLIEKSWACLLEDGYDY